MTKIKERTRIISFMLMLALMICMAAPVPTYAENEPGNKAINLHGYAYTTDGALKIYFDKNASSYVQKDQFKIYNVTDSCSVDVSSFSFSVGTGSGWSSEGTSTGTTVTLTSASAFGVDKRYQVTVSNTVKANNNLTLGSYQNRKDYVFEFRTPKNDGSYTTPGVISVNPADDPNYDASTAIRIPQEGNVEFMVNQPVASGDVDTVKSNIKLEKWNSTTSTWDSVIMDDTFDGNSVTGAECYTAQVNDDHTCFFFPLTAGGTASVSYNLDFDKKYRITIPTIPGITAGSQFSYFRTTSNWIPGKLAYAPSASSVTSTSAVLTWSTSIIDPYPSGYNVYWSDNQYWGFENHKVNTSPITTTGTSITSLTPNTTYYFRVTPVNDYGEAGYSPSVTVTTNAN